MVQGVYVPAIDGDAEVRQFSGLWDIAAAVGGLAEPVDVPSLGITIYVNDEGIARRMPFNPRASFLWWYHVPGATRAMLVGDAVIVGAPDAAGHDTDISQDVLELFTTDEEYAVLIQVGSVPMTPVDTESMMSHVLLPLVHGDPRWCLSMARYDDYFSATGWAQLIQEQWPGKPETTVVKVTDLEPRLRDALPYT